MRNENKKKKEGEKIKLRNRSIRKEDGMQS